MSGLCVPQVVWQPKASGRLSALGRLGRDRSGCF